MKIKETGIISRQALSWLRDQKLPSSPVCYHVAYAYIEHPDPDLNQRIEQLQGSDAQKLQSIHQIYQDFIVAKLENNINQFTTKIDNIANQTLLSVSTTKRRLNSFSSTLGEAHSLLSSSSGDANLNVITLLIDETEKINRYADNLEEQLKIAAFEIKALQQEHLAFKDRANRDPLTQILNRYGMQHAFELIADIKSAFPLVVLIADIDYFKKFNDEYGHLVGDSVLKVVASTLESQVKHSDILARFGGEEFILLLPKTSFANGLIVAESLRHQIETLTIKKRNSSQNLGKITLSMGVAKLEFDENLNDAIERADRALYRAKNNGRNCIESE